MSDEPQQPPFEAYFPTDGSHPESTWTPDTDTRSPFLKSVAEFADTVGALRDVLAESEQPPDEYEQFYPTNSNAEDN